MLISFFYHLQAKCHIIIPFSFHLLPSPCSSNPHSIFSWRIRLTSFSAVADLVLKDKIVVYDLAGQRIGWANFDCKFQPHYQKKAYSRWHNLLLSSRLLFLSSCFSTQPIFFVVLFWVWDQHKNKSQLCFNLSLRPASLLLMLFFSNSTT